MLWAVRWHCLYAVSYRDLEAMTTERGVAVDHCSNETRHRQVKYLNNVVEIDHGKLKLLIRRAMVESGVRKS